MIKDIYPQLAHFSWFYLAYGGVLFYLLIHPAKMAKPRLTYLAAVGFAAAAFLELPYMLLRQVLLFFANGNAEWPGVWLRGLSWTLLALSMLAIVWGMIPAKKAIVETSSAAAPEPKSEPIVKS